mmetsp:Transcript_114189/g.170804  ORF Transcript_114189/g.170804 Transcript_114189/m.170804 type:complete len:328 (+) Transcript_114189:424-1407(+)
MPQGLPNSNATNRDGGSGLERSAKQPSCITTRSSAAHLGLATRGRAELEAEVDLLKPVARTSERGDHDRLARLLAVERLEEVRLALDLHPVQPGDDVSDFQPTVSPDRAPQAGLLCGRAWWGLEDQDALGDTELASLLCLQERDPDRRSDHLATLDEAFDHLRHGVARDCEADAGRRSRGREDGGVHADQAPAAIEQRAARVSRVDRSVGLDHVGDGAARWRRCLTSEPRDHAGRERVIEPERVSDSQRNLPDLDLGGFPDSDWAKRTHGCFDFEHGNVFVGVDACKFCFVCCGLSVAVQKPDLSRVRAADDVKVGNNVALGVPHEA